MNMLNHAHLFIKSLSIMHVVKIGECQMSGRIINTLAAALQVEVLLVFVTSQAYQGVSNGGMRGRADL